jgi:flagellar basal-body rod modification protein FlgD
MTSPIPTGTSIYTATPAGAAPGSKKLADQDTFLKLLVAQLKYQDPTNPADSTQFLAQTAQFTQVEKLGAIAESQQNMLNAQLMLGASNLVGRTVSYVGPDGADVTGVVSSAKLGGSDPTLRVGDTDVQLSKVKEVRQNS